MGVYNSFATEGRFDIPMVPWDGASGGGYGDIYVSLSTPDPVHVDTQPMRNGQPLESSRGWDLPAGRTVVAIITRGTENPPTSLRCTRTGSSRVDWICEWERPPE